MENVQGACYYNCFRKSSLVGDEEAKLFNRQQILPVADGASGITRCERAHENDASKPGVLKARCKGHFANNKRSRVLSRWDFVVTRLTHFQKSLAQQSAFKIYRSLNKDAVGEMVIFNTTDLPDARAVEALQRWLDVFCPPNSRANRYRRSVISSLVHSAPLDRGLLHCERACGKRRDEAACKKRFMRDYHPVICGKRPLSFISRSQLDQIRVDS